MIRFIRPIAILASTLLIVIGCAGAPPAATRSSGPDETGSVSTLAPTTTRGIATTTPAGPAASTLDIGTDRPTTVDATLGNGGGNEFAAGSFTSSAGARQCGSVEYMPRGFLFGFPHDIDPHDIEDVSFAAQELLPGTSTSLFSISVSIAPAAAGGPHPKTFLDTSDPTEGASGSAQVSVAANGARNLSVDVADKYGISVHLTAVCSPI